jgi:hypothetical protein
MRRVTLLLALAACGDHPPPEDKPVPPEPPVVPPRTALNWVRTQPLELGWDLELWIPEPWTKGYKVQDDQIFFAGPDADGGWQPELQFGWRTKEKSLDEWAGERIRFLEGLPTGKVQAKGSATVAGMPAVWFIYGFERNAEGRSQPMREINFYFAGHGGIGFVRGVSTARTFDAYAPVYREAAARLRYNAQ